MSVEHQSSRPEQSAEAQHEIDKLAAERLSELAAEKTAEQPRESNEQRAEAARDLLKEHMAEPESVVTPPETSSKVSFPARISQALNYQHTLQSLQRRLKPASRSFSKVIHTPAVEKTSEALEKTIMRPSVTLGATWTAVIVGAVFYFTARHYDYRLSGSEMLLALVIGGVLGILLEGLFRALRKR